MKFTTVFDLRIKHEYYTDGRCPDFIIQAPPRTQRLLKNYRCVLKDFPDGIRMLTASDAAKNPFISFPEDLALTFELQIENQDFALFTNLSEFGQMPAAVFTNAHQEPDQDNLLLPVAKTTSWKETFEITDPGTETYFVLGIQPLEGTGVDDFIIDGPQHLMLTGFNATDRLVEIDSRSATAGDAFDLSYPARPKLERNVFAEIALHYHIDRHPPGDNPVEFNIAFKARKVKWKYYLITDQKKTVEDFKIKTNGASSEITAPIFSDGNRRDLKLSPDSLDDIARDLAPQYPELQLYRFISDDPIACRQSPWKNLQLTMNDIPIVSTLPNPSIRNLSEIITEDGSIQQKQDALFKVIKYLTQSFQ